MSPRVLPIIHDAPPFRYILPMSPAVFLDRDNTVIHNSGDLGEPGLVRLVQGAAMAIASLCGLGYKIVIVTNQGGVARGKYSEEDVEATHERLRELIMAAATGARIDGFYFCPYHPEGTVEKYKKEHPERKPQPGMLLRAAKELKLDLPQSWMVGDTLRDIEAGKAAGVRTVLVRDPRLEHNPLTYGADDETVKPEFEAETLIEAVRMIASARKPEAAEVLGREQARGRRWDREAVAKVQRPREGGVEVAEAVRVVRGIDETQPRVSQSRTTRGLGRGGVASGDTAEGGVGVGGGEGGGAAGVFRPWDVPEERAGAKLGERVKAVGKRMAGVVDAGKEAWERHQAERTQRLADEAEQEELMEREAGLFGGGASGEEAEGGRTGGGAETDVERRDEVESDLSVVPATPPARMDADDGADAAHGSRAAGPPAAGAGDEETTRLLRQVLRELRHQRLASAEFSTGGLIAAVLQVLAVVCLLGGLWMGGADATVFVRWLGTAVMLQLATIAVLLFPR